MVQKVAAGIDYGSAGASASEPNDVHVDFGEALERAIMGDCVDQHLLDTYFACNRVMGGVLICTAVRAGGCEDRDLANWVRKLTLVPYVFTEVADALGDLQAME